MLRFIKKILVVFIALTLFSFCAIAVLIGIGTVAMSDMDNELQYIEAKPNTIIELNLKGKVTEVVNPLPFGISLDGVHKNSLIEIVTKIQKATQDENVKAILLSQENFVADWVAVEEIRHELALFKQSGKLIYSYADNYSQKEYYLASVADTLMIHPQGMVEIHGVRVGSYFMKGLLDKVGIKAVVVTGRGNTYKSAGESLTRRNMSKESREVLTEVTSSLWNNFSSSIATDRNVPQSKVDEWANSLITLSTTTEIQASGLVDLLGSAEDLKGLLEEQLGVGGDKHYLSLKRYNTIPPSTSSKIAILLATGVITGNMSTGATGDEIHPNEFIETLKELTNDEAIKAIVLRINSPGGDAFSSEKMWNAIYDAKKKKPIVVSMGSYAASGGYYLASAADKIVANNSTMTGSIGVILMLLNTAKIMENLDVEFDQVVTHQHTDMLGGMREFTPFEKQKMQNYIDIIYTLFKKRVADGRGLTIAQVEEIAKGRVWIGKTAKEIGLVDTIGGINTAIDLAKELADIKTTVQISTYPKTGFKLNLLPLLLDQIGLSSKEDFNQIAMFRSMGKTVSYLPIQLK